MVDHCLRIIFFGFPYVFFRAGITFSAFVNEISLAVGYLEPRCCTTTKWFKYGNGPNRSTATNSQFFSRTLF